MDEEKAVELGLLELGLLAAFLMFTALFVFTVDLFVTTEPNSARRAEKLARVLHAVAMTVAPTSDLAVAIDVGAAVVALFGLVKAAKVTVRTGVRVAVFLYFFTSFMLNYFTAPL